MSARLEVETTESVVENGYKVAMRVLEASGIEAEVFVFSANDHFSHVATTRDMANSPPSQTYALEFNLPFYRAAQMEITLQTPVRAREAKEALDSRISGLISEWNSQPTPPFGGQTTKVYE